jgi:hypothetical protein
LPTTGVKSHDLKIRDKPEVADINSQGREASSSAVTPTRGSPKGIVPPRPCYSPSILAIEAVSVVYGYTVSADSVSSTKNLRVKRDD